MLLIEDEEGMVHMLGKIEDILDRKKLEMNVEKTKMIRFRKGEVRITKVQWRWKGKRIEEVEEFSYLGYKLQRNGGRRDM